MKKKPSTVELMNRNNGKGCGECKFFTDECAEGMGICIVRKTPLIKFCGDLPCSWFNEREGNDKNLDKGVK